MTRRRDDATTRRRDDATTRRRDDATTRSPGVGARHVAKALALAPGLLNRVLRALQPPRAPLARAVVCPGGAGGRRAPYGPVGARARRERPRQRRPARSSGRDRPDRRGPGDAAIAAREPGRADRHGGPAAAPAR